MTSLEADLHLNITFPVRDYFPVVLQKDLTVHMQSSEINYNILTQQPSLLMTLEGFENYFIVNASSDGRTSRNKY